MSSAARVTLREAYLGHDEEWVVMDLTNADCIEDWDQEGVILFHGKGREEAHSAAKTEARCTRDDGKRREIWVFKGTKHLVPGEHLRRACESISYRHDLDPRALKL